ncbi:MAG TPA: 4-alpha-glucanotransferase [Methanotrichaceae archaeon]|nr:4-alpha-glucanotransferase [Methanotrichaceae archaeon]
MKIQTRGSGVLLHITSLPSSWGIGDIGPEAHKFADFLAGARQSYWQVLPLSPVDPAFGNTPYDSISAFAGNQLLISPDLLMVDGLLYQEDMAPVPAFEAGIINYPAVISFKDRILDKAYQKFKSKGENPEYEAFCSKESSWLDDFALFKSIKADQGGAVWSKWPEGLRDRQKDELQKAADKLKDGISREKFLQYVFFKQWRSLKARCNSHDIKIIGDAPIYVNYDSADVWANQSLFNLDSNKHQTASSGVPPDYFSATGQLWGNPLYNWDVIKGTGFDWWIRRLGHNFSLFDLLRIDHFRGLVAYWEVPAGETTAINGRWVEAPAEDFLAETYRHFNCVPIIAEDLGIITPAVREVMSRFEIPGMMVLLFAFGEGMPKNPYVPHNHQRNRIVYTGTHDNNTVKGWFENEASSDEKRRFFSYIGREINAAQAPWEMIRLAMMSVADVAILTMQDLLGLGAESRMNHPGTTKDNYRWQITPGQVSPDLSERLREMTEIYNRT